MGSVIILEYSQFGNNLDKFKSDQSLLNNSYAHKTGTNLLSTWEIAYENYS